MASAFIISYDIKYLLCAMNRCLLSEINYLFKYLIIVVYVT